MQMESHSQLQSGKWVNIKCHMTRRDMNGAVSCIAIQEIIFHTKITL